MSSSERSVIVLVALAILLLGSPGPSGCQDTITISGVVTGPGGAAVAGVEVVGWTMGGEASAAVTDDSGSFSLSVQPGEIGMHVLPPIETRLVERHMMLGHHHSSFTFSVELVAGHLLEGTILDTDGNPTAEPYNVELLPMVSPASPDEWFGGVAFPDSGEFHVVVPPDVYWVRATPPPPLYGRATPVDLRSGDVSAVVLETTEEIVSQIPYDPPDAGRITVGAVDDLGEAIVSGAPGAALALAHVLVVNLSSTHQAHTVSAADGSFSLSVFAPAGSALMVKHGPASGRWFGIDNGVAEGLNPYPGTILHVADDHGGNGAELDFAVAGGIEVESDDDSQTANRVGAAWAMRGTLSRATGGGLPDSFVPGDVLRVTGTMRISSHGISASTDPGAIVAVGFPGLMLLFDGDGRPLAAENYFMSTVITPGGFPIQGAEMVVMGSLPPVDLHDFTVVGDHAVEASYSVDWELPLDLPSGLYRPVVFFDFHNVPTGDGWVAAQVFAFGSGPGQALLPPLVVDDGTLDEGFQPRLLWRLLMDDVHQGTRGSSAREDQGRFEFATQIVSQGAPHIVPPRDPRSGNLLRYRLEPHLPMISATDRRVPGPPLIPFELPGGRLSVHIQSPDGSAIDLGEAQFAQSFNRTATSLAGHDLNPGTTQIDDIYSLTTGDDAFQVSFDRFGHHVVTMTGEVEDGWGTTYTGGGTYDLWVAYPLDIEPAVLPGAPLEVGGAFNPALHISPRVPADVTVVFTLYPESDASQAMTWTVTGRANRYGVFGPQQAAIVPASHGEYRVDIVAAYTSAGGELYMAAMTWGGVVMTPAAQAHLVAHGRRGLDSLGYVAPTWFVNSRDLVFPEGAVSHSFNPYYAGDILWSRMSDGPWGGDALLVQASVQDTVGTIQTAIEDRIRRRHPDHGIPEELQERIDAGELPLFTTTTGDRPIQIAPEQAEQIAYSYRSSQRPGVRVREVVSEDNQSGGYWRLDTLYDDQAGVGLLGDQVNDFKFQFVGTVYRDLVSAHSEYGGQATGWVFVPDGDPVGTRVMPPFAGPGNGGWTTEGGPLLTLDGEDVHIFFLPTGTRPGAVLEVGDTLTVAGHVMPTLSSRVQVTVTSPGGAQHLVEGQADRVGSFYDPTSDLVVSEPGVWMVDVRVWHQGQCSGGTTVAPYPTGGVLGSEAGRYRVYVAPIGAQALDVASPSPGFLDIAEALPAIVVSGRVPQGHEDATVHYTVTMPGYILDQGQVSASSGQYRVVYDPVALSATFPNLDLIGREDFRPGLSDSVSIGLLLVAQGSSGSVVRANTVVLQGEHVFVGDQFEVAAPRRPSRRVGR